MVEKVKHSDRLRFVIPGPGVDYKSTAQPQSRLLVVKIHLLKVPDLHWLPTGPREA